MNLFLENYYQARIPLLSHYQQLTPIRLHPVAAPSIVKESNYVTANAICAKREATQPLTTTLKSAPSRSLAYVMTKIRIPPKMSSKLPFKYSPRWLVRARAGKLVYLSFRQSACGGSSLNERPCYFRWGLSKVPPLYSWRMQPFELWPMA